LIIFKFNQSKNKWVVFEEKEENVSMVVVVWQKEIGVGRLAAEVDGGGNHFW